MLSHNRPLILLSCPESSFWGRCFFRVRQDCERTICGRYIRCLSLSRPNRLPASHLLRMVGTSPVILSEHIVPHERDALRAAGIAVFDPSQKPFQAFSKRLCLNAAIELLSLSGIPFPCQSLGIIDPAFQYAELAEHAVRHLTQVRILTDKLAAAEKFSQKMMAEYGASVMIGSDEAILSPLALIFSPCGILPTLSVPVILPKAPDLESSPDCVLFHSPLPLLQAEHPLDFPADFPRDISELAVLSALYSLAGCRRLAKLGCREITVCSAKENASQTLYDAAGYLQQSML